MSRPSRSTVHPLVLSLPLARCNLSSQIRQVTFGKPGSKLTAVLILSGSSRRLLCRLLYTRYHPVVTLRMAMPVRPPNSTGDNAPFNLYIKRLESRFFDRFDDQTFAAFVETLTPPHVRCIRGYVARVHENTKEGQ